MRKHLWLRILAVLIIPPTLIALAYNGMRDGIETLYFLLPDVVICVGLLWAAIHGAREALLTAYAAAGGVFITAVLGALWTQGLAAAPPGAAIGAIACAISIFVLLRPKSAQAP